VTWIAAAVLGALLVYVGDGQNVVPVLVRFALMSAQDITRNVSVDVYLDVVFRVFATTQRSRIPVYRGSEDHILGFVHIKDML
jgi:CBS domain containing-hemolysin-like protein